MATMKASYLFRDGRFIYCSRCGARIGQDDYSLRGHIRFCTGKESSVSWSPDKIMVYQTGNARDNFFARFFRDKDTIIFRVCRFSWHEGETVRSIRQNTRIIQVYSCTFYRDGHREERGSGTVEWYFRMLDNRMLFLNTIRDDMVLFHNLYPWYLKRMSFSALLGMIVSGACLKRKGSCEDFPSLSFNRVSAKEQEFLADGGCRALIQGTECGGGYYLRIILKIYSDITEVLLSGDDVRSPSFIRFEEALLITKDMVMAEPGVLERYRACYPERKIDQYDGGCPLIPLLGPYAHPIYELVYKAGINDLADLLHPLLYDKEIAFIPVSWRAKNLSGFFGLTVKQLRKVRKVDHFWEHFEYLLDLRQVNEAFLDVEAFTEPYLEFISGHMGFAPDGSWSCPLFNRISGREMLRVLRYVSELKNRWEYEIYVDYLRTCRELDAFPLGLCPKNLSGAHDDAAFLFIRRRKALLLETEFQEALRDPGYKRLTTTEGGEGEALQKLPFIMIQPANTADMERESHDMHNCVATYTGRVARKETWILFLRKRKDPEKSYVTVEVKPGKGVSQVKAFANRPPSQRVRDYIRAWALEKCLLINTRDVA